MPLRLSKLPSAPRAHWHPEVSGRPVDFGRALEIRPGPDLTCLWRHLCQEIVQSGPDLTASERRCNGPGSGLYLLRV
jgi:hypothetical protein